MRRRILQVAGSAPLVAVLIAFAGAVHVAAQAAAPSPVVTAGRAKDLVAALQTKQLEAFAISDTAAPGRYVAVLYQTGIQLLVVSAAYERTSDMDYRFYHKDYMNAYLDLRTGVLSKDKVFIEDAGADGLVAMPGKNLSHDSITASGGTLTFDGAFADPKKKDVKKLSQADYMKRFADAEEQYGRLLGLLIEGLKK